VGRKCILSLHSIFWLDVVVGNEALKLVSPNFHWTPGYHDSFDGAYSNTIEEMKHKKWCKRFEGMLSHPVLAVVA
jgi:hypothetical protein